jgi:DNA invertase Pin-like site-specific DNA recombinase
MVAEDHRTRRLRRQLAGPSHAERELKRLGETRRQALTTAEQALDDIAKLLPAALEAGLTTTEIAKLTGVSRPTIYTLKHQRPARRPPRG